MAAVFLMLQVVGLYALTKLVDTIHSYFFYYLRNYFLLLLKYFLSLLLSTSKASMKKSNEI